MNSIAARTNRRALRARAPLPTGAICRHAGQHDAEQGGHGHPVADPDQRLVRLPSRRGLEWLGCGGLDNIPFENRNSLVLAFTSPVWRSAMVDWAESAARLVAQFRAALAEHVAEASWKCLVKRLREESPEFARMWHEHEVRAPESLTKRYLRSEVGLLRLDYMHLWFGRRSESRLTTHTPADEETWQKIRELHALTEI